MRQTNQNKWDQRFFTKLNQQEKLLWIYLNDNCDEAGFISVNWQRWSEDIGGLDDTSTNEFLSKLQPFGILCDTTVTNYWFVVPFLREQCGRLSRACPGHKKVWWVIDEICPDLLDEWTNTYGHELRFKPAVK